jgi:hypothetical protein
VFRDRDGIRDGGGVSGVWALAAESRKRPLVRGLRCDHQANPPPEDLPFVERVPVNRENEE